MRARIKQEHLLGNRMSLRIPARRAILAETEAAMADDSHRRLAVLIDADNASARIVEGLFEEVAKLGEASVRRIYGDFSSTRSSQWAKVLQRYAIIPHQQFAYTTGKNASDMALVIDAMDLLHSGRVDGFCLVSSDSDFASIATRIREEGVDVFGFGERKTPEAFVQACRRFIYTENLLPDAPGQKAEAGRTLEPLGKARDLILRVLSEQEADGDWLTLGALGSQITKIAPDFDPRTYGHKQLSALVRHIDALEFSAENGPPRVRAKPAAPPPPARKAAGRRKTAPAP
jgi:hypothetical protein